ncbi:MAG: polyprenol phosphomannose-dependent alpha 1,6 mannosyltransferase MptB, partial [Frankiales bacterium]|nr:polyprenol phosphomannose-dependent alpha 1,6 mannosyltransferase MptB [Frankiales bacterium]
GPLWLGLAGLVVRVTGSVVPSLVGMRLLAIVGLALLAWALLRLTEVPGRALWLGVANPLVLVHLLSGAHNDALMIGLMAAGLAVAGRGGRWLAIGAALVTGGALIKVPAVAALAFLPLLAASNLPGRLRASAVVGLSAVATAVIVTLVSGLGWGWLGSLDAGRARLALFSPLTGLGVLVGQVDAVLAGGLVVAAVVGLGLLLAADRLGPLRACGLLLLSVSLLLPVVQPWYVLWGVVLLGACSSARGAAGLGAACLVLTLLVQPSGRSVVRPPLYGVPMALAAVAGCLVARRHRSLGVEVVPTPAPRSLP